MLYILYPFSSVYIIDHWFKSYYSSIPSAILKTLPSKYFNKYVSALYPELICKILPFWELVIIKLPAICTLSLSENVWKQFSLNYKAY